jgi:RimJ/RimL family protein N-acetyltransferase
VIDHGFDHGFDEIIAAADGPNAPSVRVMEKLGMHRWKRQIRSDTDHPQIYYRAIKR